ncbi:hypothetical protein WN943_027613 [Citrus x changshan-huyou]
MAENDGDEVTNQKKKKRSDWARTRSGRRSVTKQMAATDGDEVANQKKEKQKKEATGRETEKIKMSGWGGRRKEKIKS